MPVPGPAPLGRGVVVSSGSPVPGPWRDAPVVTIDDAVLADPAAVVRRLHAAWLGRQPVVVALGLDPARFREPQSFPIEPWRAAPEAEPWFDRLHFLTWANTYDARAGEPVWWWAVKAARLDDAATVRAMLERAGWRDVAWTPRPVRLPVGGGRDPAGAAAVSMQLGPTRIITKDLDPDLRDAAEAAIAAALAEHVDADGHVVLGAAIGIVSATR